MVEPDRRSVTLEELLISNLTQTDTLAKLLIEKGADYPRRVYAEDFRGTGDVSEIAESDAAMNLLNISVAVFSVLSGAYLIGCDRLQKINGPRLAGGLCRY